MKITLLYIALTGFLFVQCDPTRRIHMKNKSAGDAEVIWRTKEDSIGFNPFNLSNSKELKFSIQPNKEIKMSFGLGIWSNEALDSLVRHLVSLEIKSINTDLKIDSTELLKDFLIKRRSGARGNKIEVVIEK